MLRLFLSGPNLLSSVVPPEAQMERIWRALAAGVLLELVIDALCPCCDVSLKDLAQNSVDQSHTLPETLRVPQPKLWFALSEVLYIRLQYCTQALPPVSL